jgi:glyoxylase-like metal-dependent hydrolase (beta-lactamase superfamily II)
MVKVKEGLNVNVRPEEGVEHGILTIRLTGVNCYLATVDGGFVLIDTGTPEKRARLEAELEKAGCRPGNLRLIALTHGDYDHAGNAAYLRDKYGAEIGMHRDDAERVERADWDLGMKPKPDRFTLFFRVVSKVAVRLVNPDKFVTFKPDVYLEDGQSLSTYGLDAVVLHLGGHTRGSIGILTAEGELLCGDLMINMGRPSLHFFINDMAVARASIDRLRGLGVSTVYSGHGKPFRLERLKVRSR